MEQPNHYDRCRGDRLIYLANMMIIVGLLLLFLFVIAFQRATSHTQVTPDTQQPHKDWGPLQTPDIMDMVLWGHSGHGVRIDARNLYHGHQDEYREGYRKYGLNKYLSDRISMRRTLPDVRHPACQQILYTLTILPRASIIVVFRNVPRTTLLRMLYSVHDRSPLEVIQEIILVDDNSHVDDLKFPVLEHYLSGLKKVKILRLTQFHGPARAGMRGVQLAVGEIIIFMKPLCEVTDGWITPLLQWISKDKSVIAVPVLDQIHVDTFEYINEPMSEVKVGSFTWELAGRRRQVTEVIEDLTKQTSVPVIIDGIFAMDRKNLFRLGGLDESLFTEAGVFLEFSFRSWMCGSQIILVPCSHVGFLFQAADHLPGNDSISDRLRIANSWMDGYKYFVYERILPISQQGRQQLVSSLNLKTLTAPMPRASCQSFHWYLQTVETSMLIGWNIVRRGQLVMLGISHRVLSLGVRGNHVVLQDWTSSPPIFWYHHNSGTLATENQTCLTYFAGENSESILSAPQFSNKWPESHKAHILPQGSKTSVDTQSLGLQNLSLSNQMPGRRHLLGGNQSLQTRVLVSEEQDTVVRAPDQVLVPETEANSDNSPGGKGQEFHVTQIQTQSDLHEPDLVSNFDTKIQPGSLRFTQETGTLPVAQLVVAPCGEGTYGDQWVYTETKTLQHVKSGLCMEAHKSKSNQYFLGMVKCDGTLWGQHWTFISTFKSEMFSNLGNNLA